jgi:hypothetical protein
VIVALFYAMCDGCGAPHGGVDDLAETRWEARQRAERTGWKVQTRRGSVEDFCPECAVKQAVAS